jgi:hypothetical protein
MDKGTLSLILPNPDFTNASRVAQVINKALKGNVAKTVDAGTIEVSVPKTYRGDTVALVAMIEQLEITPDQSSKVVINERTGTVVIGENVRLSTVAIAHGNLSIEVKETANVSQPMPFSNNQSVGWPGGGGKGQQGPPREVGNNGTIVAPGGNTVVTNDTNINVKEDNARLLLSEIRCHHRPGGQSVECPRRYAQGSHDHISGPKSRRGIAGKTGGNVMMDAMNLQTMPYQSMDLAKKVEALSHQVDSKKLETEDPSEVEKACTDMESLFIFYLLKEMRATIPKDGYLSGGKGEEIYTSMLDSQLAKELAAERGIGLSPLLSESLARKENNASSTIEKK